MERRLDIKLVETENFTVGQDWEVPISGFLILATKKVVYKRVTEFDKGMQHEFIELLVKVRKLMEIVLKIEDVYFFQNEDTEHGFHVWIFPRHKWMEKFGRKIESVRPIMRYAKENMWTEENIQDVKETIQRLKSAL